MNRSGCNVGGLTLSVIMLLGPVSPSDAAGGASATSQKPAAAVVSKQHRARASARAVPVQSTQKRRSPSKKQDKSKTMKKPPPIAPATPAPLPPAVVPRPRPSAPGSASPTIPPAGQGPTLEPPPASASQEAPVEPFETAGPAAAPESTLGSGTHAELGGIVRADYYSASKQLNSRYNLGGVTVQPKFSAQVRSWLDLKAEGRLTYQDLTHPRPQIYGSRFLEGYGTLHLGRADLRLGQQNIVWGRADGYNPTDVLTPQDFTLLSARDFVDRRFGLPSALGTISLSPTMSFSAVWIPVFQSSIIPLPPTLPFNLQLVRQLPNNDYRNQEFAVKLDRSGAGIDWSLSYFQGFDLIPFGQVAGANTVLLRNQRIRVIGADMATTVGRYGVRAETAYTRTDDPYGSNPEARNPSWLTVIGGDRDLAEGVNFSLQFYLRYIFNFVDRFQTPVPNPLVRQVAILNDITGQQMDRWQTGVIGRLRATWLHDTLEGEVFWIFNSNRTDFFLRPSLGYAVTDIWKVYVGADIFNGRSQSYFGRVEKNSALFAEVRATF